MAAKKKKDVILIRSLLALFILLFIGSIIFLIQNKVGVKSNDVLSQINKFYETKQINSDIFIYVQKNEKVNLVLNKVEAILSKKNKTIKDYSLDKTKNKITLTLKVQDNYEPTEQFRIIIQKDIETVKEPVEPFMPTPQSNILIPNRNRVQICIIIDDAGYNNKNNNDFISLPIKMGIAVLPFIKSSQKIAQLIHEHNKEVILHMPMEPKNYESRHIRLFERTILCNMDQYQIEQTMDDMLNNLKYAVGINNHQGSKATEDYSIMENVLSYVKRNNLFFIDSLTSQQSVTVRIAKNLGVNYGKRDVFLDNKNDYSYIKNQMEKLIAIALKKGKAIGIGHIQNINTYKVIRDYIPIIESKNIEFVFPSDIIYKFYNKEVSKNVTKNNFCFN